MVLPGIASHSPLDQSRTSNGWASSAALSCWIGVRTTSRSTPRTSGATAEKVLAMALKISQSDFDSHAGSTAAESGWMKGCMSEVLRSFFSYQVAVGRTMSDSVAYTHLR